ncbi:TetR/AcrR family transcriptional regulator [Ferrimonas lipolytica]|uniref:TetR/AcrR family transcriptional regulator n=1 Tax=Ferrimonas lipolytica TaxID=2724191 RepID=A0A6H1UK39_9GAMM|nr:TetR/AcrR family transcriptional regulator [Ferrimonas lipolytica]QIZ78172.1 TetR/AcrR family transcriptional regulator [Ferrimonas lipolytica]
MHCPQTSCQLTRCNHLLDTAERLIETQGIVSFKFSQVAKEAEVANASFYKLFESKEDLLVCSFLRNATSNHIGGFLQEYPNLNALEKVLLPIIFTFETIHFAPTFFMVRQVAVNPMVWSLASPEKITVFKQRINQYWGWITQFLEESVTGGDLIATEQEVLELTQGITFYLSGALSALQSQLIEKNYLREARVMLFRQLELLFSRYQWQTPLTLSTFERIGMRVHLYYKQNRARHNSCQGCIEQQQA